MQTLLWLEDLYALVARGEQEKAGNLLFTKVFDSFQDPTHIDLILKEVDFDRLDTLLVIGVLSATNPVKAQLKHRADALSRARTRLNSLAPARVESLLAGLD